MRRIKYLERILVGVAKQLFPPRARSIPDNVLRVSLRVLSILSEPKNRYNLSTTTCKSARHDTRIDLRKT